MKRFLVSLLLVAGCTDSDPICADQVDSVDVDDEVQLCEPDDDAPVAQYGSTYSSNCFCLSCTKYCDVNGQTTKSGTCC